MPNAAEVIDIHKYYDLGGHIVKALRGVSLEVPEGDFLAIMGSSGSGKSTLLNLLGALDRPTRGEYIIGGRPVSQLNDNELSAIRNQMIGFIFQSYNLVPQYTVLENIEVPLHYRPGAPPLSSKDRARCRELADIVGLSDRLSHRPFQLSGGQQQRVFLARALAQDADLYLMDEPFAGVDAATERAIVDVMRNLRADGATVVCVHHDLQTVGDYFDHALILNVRPVAAGPVAEILTEENLQEAYGGRLAATEIRAIARTA